jgi:hypothetical protein
VVFRDHVLCERDIYAMVYPQIEAFVRSVAMGSWPVWDPYVGFGQPMLANPGAQVLYPWTWLNLLVSPETYYSIYALGHLLLSGVGLYLLAGRLGLSAPAAVVSSLIWVGSGPLLSTVNLWQHLAGAAWMPWVLLAVDAALSAPGLTRALLLGAAAAGQILTGSVDLVAMTALLAAGFSLRYLRPAAARETLRQAGAVALAAALAAGLTAAQWLPALEMLRASSRPSLHEAIRTYWSLHPFTLLQSVLPVFPAELPLKREHRELLFQGREPFLVSVYLGLASLALVAAALASSPRRRLVTFLGGTGAAATLFAFGKHALFYDAAVAVLPPLAVFRYPAKAMLVAALAWALLAGLGYDAWKSLARAGSPLRALAPTLAGAALAGLLLLATHAYRPALQGALLEAPETLPSFEEKVAAFRGYLAWAALVGAAAGALLLRARSAPALAARLPAALALLAVVDLVRVHHDLNYALPRGLLSRPLACVEVIPQRHLARYYAFDEFIARMLGKVYPLSLRDAGQRERALQPYRFCMAANRWGLSGSYDIDPLHLYPPFLRNLNQVFTAAESHPGFARLLRIGAVSYVFSLHKEGLGALTPIEGLPEPTRVYRVPDTLPRAYVVGGARVASDFDALRLFLDPGFDFRREVVLPSGTSRSPEATFAGECRVVAFRPDRVRIEARLSHPGFLVLVDAYDPNWRVTLNGEPSPLLRANVAFRAVALPPGAHAVEMTYRPRSVGLGLGLSAASLALGLALFARARSRRGA